MKLVTRKTLSREQIQREREVRQMVELTEAMNRRDQERKGLDSSKLEPDDRGLARGLQIVSSR